MSRGVMQQALEPIASEADTEELIRIGELPEPLRLAAMLEKTMQWPLHGKAADCLRRMYAEQRQPLTDAFLEALAEKHVTNCYFDTVAYARAIEAAHGIKASNA